MNETPVTLGLLIALVLALIAIVGLVIRFMAMSTAVAERLAIVETKVERLDRMVNGRP